jgi:hypothetical protein
VAVEFTGMLPNARIVVFKVSVGFAAMPLPERLTEATFPVAELLLKMS